MRTKNCNNPMFVPENRQCRGVLELNGHAPQRYFMHQEFALVLQIWIESLVSAKQQSVKGIFCGNLIVLQYTCRCASLLLNCLQTATTLLAGSWPAFPKVLISSLTASICSCFGLFQDASSIH